VSRLWLVDELTRSYSGPVRLWEITVDPTLLLSHVLCIWNSRDAPKNICIWSASTREFRPLGISELPSPWVHRFLGRAIVKVDTLMRMQASCDIAQIRKRELEPLNVI
jgi:hypothetical protein